MSVKAAHEALAASAALRAASTLGVLERLDAAPLDSDELARDCGLSPRGSRALLTALAALDLVEPLATGRYRPAPAAGLLVHALELFDGLADAVRDGGPVQPWDAGAVAGKVYAVLVPLLAELHEPAAARAADVLARPCLQVLDVAAGGAPWSLAIAGRDPTVGITALDLPEVLPQTRRAAEQRGLKEQYRFIAGDAFTSDLGGPYDVALIANFCHLFGADANLRLLRRLRDVLSPGGRIGVIDVVPTGRTIPSVALYELSLFLRTTAGAAHRFSTYVDWLTRCGYRGIERVDLEGPGGLTLMLASLDG